MIHLYLRSAWSLRAIFLYVREGALGGEGYAVQICVRICSGLRIYDFLNALMEVVELGRSPSNRQNLPPAAFAGHIGAFAIHGSGLALGNVLLPSCWGVGRALRKSNILHSHKYTHISAPHTQPTLWRSFGACGNKLPARLGGGALYATLAGKGCMEQ